MTDQLSISSIYVLRLICKRLKRGFKVLTYDIHYMETIISLKFKNEFSPA